jgi:hypothetical protein
MAKTIARFPLHRAPFYFGPAFLSTDSEWQDAFRMLVANALDEMAVNATVECYKYTMTIRWNGLAFIIDARRGVFDVAEENSFEDDLADDKWFGFESAPRQFVDRLRYRAKDDLPGCTDDKRREILRFASGVLDGMERNFRRALHDGAYRYEARFDVLAPEFNIVAEDQMAYFSVDAKERPSTPSGEDNEFDTAHSIAGGSTLYSLCVATEAEVTKLLSTQPDPAIPTGGGARRGPPSTVDWEAYDRAATDLLNEKGVPLSRGIWTKKKLWQTACKKVGARAPRRTEAYKRINSLIEAHKLARKTKAFRQSDNSKIRPN